MVTALILSGGTGTRPGANIPKQYIKVNNRPYPVALRRLRLAGI